jgi:hypothetical protein
MADKYTTEMAATRRWNENILQDKALVEEAQCQHVHRSCDNSSHSPGIPKRGHTLDARDRNNPPARGRLDRCNMCRAEVMVMAKVKV